MSALNTPQLDTHDDDVWLSLSTMVDAEASDDEIAACLSAMKQDSDIHKRWSEYFLIGDAMRGIEPTQSDFASRFAAALANEPTVLAPGRKSWIPRIVVASFATLAVAGLLTLNGQFEPSPANLAARPLSPKQFTTTVASEESRLAPYLVAHQEFSPEVLRMH